MQRAHPFRNIVGKRAGSFDDFVQQEVGITKVRADHVPVGLLALDVEIDQVDERG